MWDYDDGGFAPDDIIDSFTIPTAGEVFNFGGLMVLEGENGIGKLTVRYHNLTAGATSCGLVEHQSTVSPQEENGNCHA